MRNPISLLNNLGIQFVPQLFSTESFPTRLGSVKSENRHQKKYEVNNLNVGILLLTGLLQIYFPCLVNVDNHIDQTQTKGLYIPRKII